MLTPRSFSRPINWLLAILLLGIFAMQGYWITRTWNRGAPIEILRAVAEPEAFHGNILHVEFSTHRRRLCITDTDRVFLTADQTVVWRERVAGLSMPVTTNPYNVRVRIILPKEHFPPGNYVFRAVVYSNCGANDFHALQEPDVPFTVLP